MSERLERRLYNMFRLELVGWLVGWLVGFFTTSSATRLTRGRVPRRASDYLICHHTETEQGDNYFCLSRGLRNNAWSFNARPRPLQICSDRRTLFPSRIIWISTVQCLVSMFGNIVSNFLHNYFNSRRFVRKTLTDSSTSLCFCFVVVVVFASFLEGHCRLSWHAEI